jgi:hypothetical protein
MSEIRYTVEETKITKLDKLLWFINTQKNLEKGFGLNFDHFPSITTESDNEEVDRVYDYMNFITNSPQLTEYITIISNRLRKYDNFNDLISDPKSGALLKRTNMQNFIMSKELQYFPDRDVSATFCDYSTTFIETVNEMIDEKCKIIEEQ